MDGVERHLAAHPEALSINHATVRMRATLPQLIELCAARSPEVAARVLFLAPGAARETFEVRLTPGGRPAGCHYQS